MSIVADTPLPPYYAVIFTADRTQDDHGYDEMVKKMLDLAREQPGFLGVESVGEKAEITVSYWSDPDAIKSWKANLEHRQAQKLGREKWYLSYKIRVSKVERDYGM
jgi:heme-degrading monooxygenase HmoA